VKIATLAETMRVVRADCEADAIRTEGMPMTGRNVGEMFGSTLAMIAAVARGVELLAEEREQ
jgi:hypothetical protein